MRNINKKCRKYTDGRRTIVDVLAVCFGIGTWVGINGIFVQLPLLVKTAPEGWNLPSYMSVTVQLANIGPMIFAVLRKIWPKKLNDTYCIYLLLFIGVMSAISLAFLYNYTTYIGGEPRSTVLFILVFLSALVGCTSSVLFFPYMRHFKEMYLVSFMIGEGLSGFLASVVALIQGVGGNPECVMSEVNGTIVQKLIYKDPLFSTHVYFGFIAFAVVLGFSAFILLNNLKVCRYERVPTEKRSTDQENFNQRHTLAAEQSEDTDDYENMNNTSAESFTKLSVLESTSLLLLISFICAFVNGVFPSIQSYSCLPYGNTAYHLSVSLSSMANPVAYFIAAFLPHASIRWMSILSSICAVFIAYVVSTSVLSPTPPLYDSVAGVVLVVLVWIIVVGLISYVRLGISTIFRAAGGSWMFYCGGASQAGSALGSLVIFFLINYTAMFVPSDPCR